MQRSLDIYLIDGEIIALEPARCVNRRSLDWLLNQIQGSYQKSGLGDYQYLCSLGQKLVNLLPRLDTPGLYGFDIKKIPQEEFVRLFIADLKDDEYIACKIIQLHTFNPPKAKPKKETIVPPPIPSSGLPDIDLWSSLVGIDESVEGALSLWNNFDLEAIYAIIHQLNELRRPPEERVNEHLDEQYQRWKAQNSNDLYNLVSIASKNENDQQQSI